MNEKIYDIYNENCPSRKVLEIISDKWTILIIEKLAQKTQRFGELKRSIGGISQKVLTNSLRALERNGFVIRQSYPVLPLKVEYSLTALGISLSLVFAVISDWSIKHIDKIMEAQALYQKVNAK